MIIEKEIRKIKERNKRVELDKAWETSMTRKITITIMTYLVMVIFFYYAGLPKPWINSIVPAIAFILSTLTIPLFKNKWMKRKRMNIKGQEEIVGFIVIVVIVMIIGMVVLGISLRKTTTVETSKKYDNYLSAMMGYTTDCTSSNGIKEYNVEEILKECLNKRTCSDGKESCEVLNKTISEMLRATNPISEESITSSYKFRAMYIMNTTENTGEEIMTIEVGECKGISQGTSKSTSSIPGIIRIELEICGK